MVQLDILESKLPIETKKILNLINSGGHQPEVLVAPTNATLLLPDPEQIQAMC